MAKTWTCPKCDWTVRGNAGRYMHKCINYERTVRRLKKAKKPETVARHHDRLKYYDDSL